MNRVLIVGEHSYIGTSFEKYVKSQSFDMEVTSVGAKNADWEKVDLTDYDTILHVAAIVHKKETPDMQQMYRKVNTLFPAELAKKAKKSGVKQFVFLSTMAVYGEQLSFINENTLPEPATMYGRSKLAAERALQKLSDETFRITILRPPMVYGKGCPGNYGRLAGLAYRMPVFPEVKNQRSMIYIENLCSCIYQEMQSKEVFRVICPQNADYVNTTELVSTIREVHGRKTWILPFPRKILQLFIKKSSTARKVFGDCCYEHKKQETDYQIADFKESVKRTEIGETAQNDRNL